MPNQTAVPDVYADIVQILGTELSIILGFRAVTLPQQFQIDEDNPEAPPELKAIVRLNNTQAKMFAIMLKRALKDLEGQNGNIPLPRCLYRAGQSKGRRVVSFGESRATGFISFSCRGRDPYLQTSLFTANTPTTNSNQIGYRIYAVQR